MSEIFCYIQAFVVSLAITDNSYSTFLLLQNRKKNLKVEINSSECAITMIRESDKLSLLFVKN